MKKSLKLFSVVLLGISLTGTTSCVQDLDITQNAKLTQSNMWKSASDVKQSTNAIFLRLRSAFMGTYTNIFYWGEVRVGDYMWGPGKPSGAQDNTMMRIRENTMTATNDGCNWSALYTTIDQCNLVLKYAPATPGVSANDLAWSIAQASFVRAYCYFWAARIWGDVPLNLIPVESITQPECYPVRAAKAEVYKQIKADIATALENGGSLGSNKYFGTLDAVNMLKAEYSLWMYSTQGGTAEEKQAYLNDAQTALEAIAISDSRLLTDFASVFSRTNKLNSEVIFALNNNQSESLLGGYYQLFYQPDNEVAADYKQKPVPMLSTQWWNYSDTFAEKLIASENGGDKRVATNHGHGMYRSNGGEITWCNKFLGDMSAQPTKLDCDLLYYRYAQAVMMYAELKYYKGDYAAANLALNIIAKRAYGEARYNTNTKAAVLDALTNEYFLEFPAEGVIWWALIRLDKIWEYNPGLVEKGKTNPNILLWPISASAINKNSKLVQTEGWN